MLSMFCNSILFIDEGNSFISSRDFAVALKNTDNYYVIVTREALPCLPYSVEEIYGIRNSGKYGNLKQIYNEFYQISGEYDLVEGIHPKKIIAEDSNSGYQFFKSIAEKRGIDKTRESYLTYTKKILNPVYKQESIVASILKIIEKVSFKEEKR